MIPMTVTTGKENCDTCGTEVKMYHMPRATAQRHLDEIHVNSAMYAPDEVAKYRDIIQTNGHMTKMDARTDARAEIGGEWKKSTVKVREGECFRIWCQQSVRFGQKRTAAMIIRIREEAALLRVRVPLLRIRGGQTNCAENYCEFTGRFDIVPVEEAARHDLEPSDEFIHQFEERRVREMFEVAELQPEISRRRAPKIIEIKKKSRQAVDTLDPDVPPSKPFVMLRRDRGRAIRRS